MVVMFHTEPPGAELLRLEKSQGHISPVVCCEKLRVEIWLHWLQGRVLMEKIIFSNDRDYNSEFPP